MDEDEAKNQLVDVMRILHERGLINIKGGNASIKIGNYFLITPSGVPKHKLKPNQIVKVYINGRWEGKMKPSIEYIMHLEIYKRRTDINAIIHSHNPFTVIATELGIELNPNEYVETRYAIGECIKYVEPLPPGTIELAKRVSEALEDCNVCILRKHGVVAIGNDIYKVLDIVEALEDLAKMNIVKNIAKTLKVITK